MTGLRRIDARDAEALADVRALLAAAERADGTPPVSDQAVLSAAQGRRAVFGLSDPLAAVGIIGEGELDLAVRPDARRRGLGRRLLTGMLEMADRDDPTAELRAWAHGENPAAEALLGGSGFEPVRTLLRLALDPADLPAAIAGARGTPPGFRFAAIDVGDAEQIAAWVRVNAAAFAHHPEQGSVTAADFTALTREPWFDPAELILAFDDGAVREEGAQRHPLAGYTWIKTVREGGRTETELYVLGVDPGYAGRGLGAALLGETLRRMAVHDPDRITLYVDGDNEHARALYARAGFAVDQRSRQWLRRGAQDARMAL